MKRQPDTLFSSGPVDAFAVAAPGLAQLVADELSARGIPAEEVTPAGVAFRAGALELLEANIWSRLASRFIVRVASFVARDFATLEKQGRLVDWRSFLVKAPVRLRVTCRKSRLYHSDAVAERVARTIRERLDVDIVTRASDEDDDESSQLVIVRFEHDQCTISVDSSGALLHRRGWRQAVAKAPLRETLAASMLAAVGWNDDCALVDPFCGSGTIGIEAALRARRIAPGLGRTFAMERWPGIDAALIRDVREKARSESLPAVQSPIVMSDRDEGACDAARSNAKRAGVLQDIVIVKRALSDVDLSDVAPEGLLLTNPPYGSRIGDGADMRSLYARLGDVVRAGGRAWRVGLLIPDRMLAGQMRMKFRTLLRTSNGGIPVSLEVSG